MVDAGEASGITRTYAVGPLMYVAATLVAFINPWVSLALFAAIAGLLRALQLAVLRRSRRYLRASPPVRAYQLE